MKTSSDKIMCIDLGMIGKVAAFSQNHMRVFPHDHGKLQDFSVKTACARGDPQLPADRRDELSEPSWFWHRDRYCRRPLALLIRSKSDVDGRYPYKNEIPWEIVNIFE